MNPGTILCGKYRLVSLMGEGGMGAVWRAERLLLAAAPVAIKIIHSREVDNPAVRARFGAEAKTLAELSSPHIVHVYEADIDPATGTPFIAMELLEGETLRDRLERARFLPPHEVSEIVLQVGRALSTAHARGIVHRDLKPANIFLVRNFDTELAKVLDFGIAKRSSQSLRYGHTATGDVLGTPFYMSPEQILSSKNIDYRSDLWSLGVIAVECMTGRLPFEAEHLPGLAMLISQGHSTLSSKLGPVPAGFDGWFERATALQPHARFESAAQMADELRLLCRASAGSTQRYGARELAPREHGGEHGGAGATQQSTTLDTALRSPPSVGPLSRTFTFGRPKPLWRRPAGKLSRRAIAGASAAVVLVAGYGLLANRQRWLAAPGAGGAAAAPAPIVGSTPAAAPEPTASPAPGGSLARGSGDSADPSVGSGSSPAPSALDAPEPVDARPPLEEAAEAAGGVSEAQGRGESSRAARRVPGRSTQKARQQRPVSGVSAATPQSTGSAGAPVRARSNGTGGQATSEHYDEPD